MMMRLSLAFCAWISFFGHMTPFVFAQSSDDSGCCAVKLPAPFDSVPAAQYIRALYPGYDEKTQMLGVDVKDEEGVLLAGQIYDAALWKGAPTEAMLVMIETYVPEENGARPEYGAAQYGLDLAAFALKDAKPVLLAKLRNANSHSGHSGVGFDQAPYRLDANRRAFGLKSSYMHMGHGVEQLTLFIADGQTFRPIFQRDMMDSSKDAFLDPLEGDVTEAEMKEFYGDQDYFGYVKSAVLIVQEKKGGTNDFKVSEKVIERTADGKLNQYKTTEIWTWNAAQSVYTKAE